MPLEQILFRPFEAFNFSAYITSIQEVWSRAGMNFNRKFCFEQNSWKGERIFSKHHNHDHNHGVHNLSRYRHIIEDSVNRSPWGVQVK